MKEYVNSVGKYFIGILGGLFMAMLLILAGSFLSRFFFEKGSGVEIILYVLLMAAGLFGNLFAVSFGLGHKNADFRWKSTLVSVLIAACLQVLVCIPFSFSIYVAGPAYPLAELLYRMINGSSSPYGTPDLYVFLCMLVFVPLYVATAMAGERLGAKKRRKDREKLISDKHR